MSKLEKLIQQYCPDGVEWRPLAECCNILDGKRKPITKGARQSGPYPYYGANGIQDWVADYIFDGTYVLIGEDGSVITPNGTPIVNWAHGKIWVNNHAHIIAETTGVLLRFLFYYIQIIDIHNLVHGNIPKLTQGDLKEMEIPVPPLPVQEEIVRVLDAFTELQTELQAELQKRLQQYNYYRDNLLSVYSDSNTVRILELQQCVSPDCSMSYGVVQPGEDFIGGIPVVRPVDLSGRIIHNKGIKTVKPILLKAYSRTELKGGELLVCVRGTTGVVAFAGEDLKGGNVTRGIVPLRFNPLVNSNYMYHLFNSRFVKKQIENKTQGAALQQINVGDLKKISIPVPPLEEQNRIVAILDRFDTLTNDLTSGLPAEMEKRRQQYEFYRDKLLTFKRKEA